MQRWRVDDPVLDDKQVLPGALGQEAVDVERDALDKTIRNSLHLDELRVHIVGAGLRHCRERVWRHPVPRRNHHVHALLEGFRPEVLAPEPGDERDVHRAVERVDAQFLVSAVGDRPDVAFLEPVLLDELDHRLVHLLLGERDVHPVDLRRVEQPVGMVLLPENRRPLGRFVAADALEHARAVMNHVRADVNVRVRPGHVLTVCPDVLRLRFFKTHITSCLNKSGAAGPAVCNPFRESAVTPLSMPVAAVPGAATFSCRRRESNP